MAVGMASGSTGGLATTGFVLVLLLAGHGLPVGPGRLGPADCEFAFRSLMFSRDANRLIVNPVRSFAELSPDIRQTNRTADVQLIEVEQMIRRVKEIRGKLNGLGIL